MAQLLKFTRYVFATLGAALLLCSVLLVPRFELRADDVGAPVPSCPGNNCDSGCLSDDCNNINMCDPAKCPCLKPNVANCELCECKLKIKCECGNK